MANTDQVIVSFTGSLLDVDMGDAKQEADLEFQHGQDDNFLHQHLKGKAVVLVTSQHILVVASKRNFSTMS